MAKANPVPAGAPASTPTPTAAAVPASPTAIPTKSGKDLLTQIRETVSTMDPAQVKAHLDKIRAQQEKRKASHKGGGSKGPLTPEQKAKRTEYNKARMAKPEVKEKMKAYRQKPETKEKMKAYRQKKAELQKALIARAKELGIDVNAPAAPPSA